MFCKLLLEFLANFATYLDPSSSFFMLSLSDVILIMSVVHNASVLYSKGVFLLSSIPQTTHVGTWKYREVCSLQYNLTANENLSFFNYILLTAISLT